MKRKSFLLGTTLLIALALIAGFLLATRVMAGSLMGDGDSGITAMDGTVPAAIFYQGRLVDDLGDPVIDDTFVMTFSLYTQLSGGAPIDVDSHTVQVTDGLFRTYMNFNHMHYNGQTLFVGVKVEGDAEMSPRHYLRPSPYALSLRPGATISGEVALGQPALKVVNTGSGNAIRGYKDGTGAAVAGVLARNFPTPVEMVAVKDSFGESGKGGELLAKYGIATQDVVEAARRAVTRKKV